MSTKIQGGVYFVFLRGSGSLEFLGRVLMLTASVRSVTSLQVFKSSNLLTESHSLPIRFTLFQGTVDCRMDPLCSWIVDIFHHIALIGQHAKKCPRHELKIYSNLELPKDTTREENDAKQKRPFAAESIRSKLVSSFQSRSIQIWVCNAVYLNWRPGCELWRLFWTRHSSSGGFACVAYSRKERFQISLEGTHPSHICIVDWFHKMFIIGHWEAFVTQASCSRGIPQTCSTGCLL